jgi:hypothetical protein
MLKNKRITLALACALALGAWSGSALSTPVSVGGITWDPASILDLTVQAVNFRESSVSNVGDTLYGYGQIGTINGNSSSDFCVTAGCDLNFTFQYTVANIDLTGPNPKVSFNLGSISFFVDNTGGFVVTNPDTAGVGSSWLTLGGHTAAYTGFAYTNGQLYSTILGPIANPLNGSSGFGLLDVTGGAAAAYFDTNSKSDGSDFSLTSGFENDGLPICDAGGRCYPISGTGQLKGLSTIPVPEPGTIGMLGLGLGFLGLFTWRRRKEAEADGRA